MASAWSWLARMDDVSFWKMTWFGSSLPNGKVPVRPSRVAQVDSTPEPALAM